MPDLSQAVGDEGHIDLARPNPGPNIPDDVYEELYRRGWRFHQTCGTELEWRELDEDFYCNECDAWVEP